MFRNGKRFKELESNQRDLQEQYNEMVIEFSNFITSITNQHADSTFEIEQVSQKIDLLYKRYSCNNQMINENYLSSRKKILSLEKQIKSNKNNNVQKG